MAAEKYFEKINHDYLIQKLDASERIKKQVLCWLKAVILDPNFHQSYAHIKYYEALSIAKVGDPLPKIVYDEALKKKNNIKEGE
jgi:hypothetical protein